MTTQPKSRLVKLTLASLAAAVALGGAAGTVAYASDQTEVAALAKAKLSLADAIRAAADQGVVVKAEFEAKKNGTYFYITTWRDGVETVRRIDPMTGAILANAADAEESDGGEARDQAAIAASVSLLDAVTAAEARGGKPLAAEFEDEDGALRIGLEVVDASGSVTEATVDARSGAVIADD